MAVADFHDFCASICALIGVDAPPLQADENGIVGFTVTHRKARIGFVERDQTEHPGVLMTLEFGVPPEEKELEILRGLMQANFMMTGIGAPAFVLNPYTRKVCFHQSYRYSDVVIESVYQGIAAAANAVDEWERTHFAQTSQAFRDANTDSATPAGLFA